MDDFSPAELTGTATLELYGAEGDRGGWHHGARYAAGTIRKNGLAGGLRALGVDAAWRGMAHAADIAGDRPAKDAVLALADRLSLMIEDAVGRVARFAVIGGDHSCAIGTWSGAYNALHHRGPLGLIWVDAHMDAHTPETSPSGRIHGMPLACLLGHGDPALIGLAHPGPALAPERVCLIGVRSYEDGEAALLDRLGVRVFFMDEVKQRGLAAVTRDALRIAQEGSVGFGVSIDLDAIDPSEAPGVGSRTPDGLALDDLVTATATMASASGFLGAEIVEYNPMLDSHDRTVDAVRDLLSALVPGSGGR